MKVLVACEFSGTVREALLAKGHDAYSCDLLPTIVKCEKGRHIREDVRRVIKQPWDFVIAHPPCTYLANSGVGHLRSGQNEDRMRLMWEGCLLFLDCLSANAPKVCVENPIQHCYARECIGESYQQLVHPWMFGDGCSKATCLWLKGLPKLVATHTKPQTSKTYGGYRLPPSPWRSRLRSITFQGIADVMADQWG